ncbi:MAG TPA: MarR family transcriptional regulator [Actinomycetota bacterium]|nr:MarR family transcriptional regulator [Actinomycetota bacterium]
MSRWLSESEQVQWRSWIAANQLLRDRLGRDVHEATGLTFADYEILVRLSESPERRMRMSELAQVAFSSRSRLSHQIDRMQKAGYVTREECRDDRRGYFAVLTDEGFQALVAAAPVHVDSVRRRIVDVLTSEEFAELGRLSQKLLDALGE